MTSSDVAVDGHSGPITIPGYIPGQGIQRYQSQTTMKTSSVDSSRQDHDHDVSAGDSHDALNPGRSFAKNEMSVGDDDALAKDLVPHGVLTERIKDSLNARSMFTDDALDILAKATPRAAKHLVTIMDEASNEHGRRQAAMAVLDRGMPKQALVAIQINMGSLMSELADKMTHQ